MFLSDLNTGEKAVIARVGGQGGFRKRIIEMGFIKGAIVECILNAPLKDPIEYKVMDYYVSLRRSEAELIKVIPEEEVVKENPEESELSTILQGNNGESSKVVKSIGKIIHVALVGNPNSGKTTLFNVASGAHERVGNYSGVTVDAKEGTFKQNGYTFKLVDLPGTYSLSSYTPEELYVRTQLLEKTPDVILNVVAASNLERNLYLSTQLIDMEIDMVMALNMYDELEKSGAKLDYMMLGTLLNIPIVPTVARKETGITELFDEIIKVYEDGRNPDKLVKKRTILINHGTIIEPCIERIDKLIAQNEDFRNKYSTRFLAVKLLENDKDVEKLIRFLPNSNEILEEREKGSAKITGMLKEDTETAITDAKYGFIAGALKETYTPNTIEERSATNVIDTFVTHKLFGYPIFIFFMWLMFQTTFSLGAYPQEWLEWLVGQLGNWVSTVIPEGALKDLLVDGIIGGVGGVIVFLPNILILYFFISFMEDSGYMARAAFIMDKIMHKMGLHGKSFIPLVMGFGCNVPAIMASRTIESRSSRMVTMLINPLMSCSARLPVYLLLVGAFFPTHASIVLLSIYLIGILMAVIVARIFKRYLFPQEDVPFVMELPPYRLPTLKSTFRHMWDKGRQYLQKMGNIILLASIVIWFLGYYPQKINYSQDYEQMKSNVENTYQQKIKNTSDIEQKLHLIEEKESELKSIENKEHSEHQQKSYIGKIGKFIEPAIKPLGFNWKIGVGIVSGIGAKEIIVSTLSVLYTGSSDVEEESTLSEKMKNDKDEYGNPVFTPLIAFCMMLFILFYFPCMATIAAIKNESGSWKWGLFTIFYTTFIAWTVTFIVYQIGSLF